jgi:hypothetical protein
MVSINNLAQQVLKKTGRGSLQEIRQDVRKSYAFAVKQLWYEAKKEGVSELNGAFIFPFVDHQPILDEAQNRYYIDLQSNYIDLPQEGGLVSVSYMSCPETNFVLCNAGSVGRLSRIKAGLMGGRQLYYPESTKLYFPRMISTSALPLIARIGIAIDDYDVDANINIPLNVQEQIVQSVIMKYATVPESINEAIK